MAIQYDIDKIFAELEQRVRSQEHKKEEEKENEESNKDTIESPEDAPHTQEVAPALSKTSEDVHGGDEASKDMNNLKTLGSFP